MQQLSFNNQQLLFVGVPIEAEKFNIRSEHIGYKWLEYPDNTGCTLLPINKDSDYQYLGTIQNSKDIVSTTIPDEVLAELFNEKSSEKPKHYYTGFTSPKLYIMYNLEMMAGYMESSGLTLQEGQKYAILKIK